MSIRDAATHDRNATRRQTVTFEPTLDRVATISQITRTEIDRIATN